MQKQILIIVILLVITATGWLFYQNNSLPLAINENTTGENVVEESATTTPVGNCYVGGCSNQICSDEEGIVSTCEFREEYACYQSAKCERQSSGQCGWTVTPELSMCLSGAQ